MIPSVSNLTPLLIKGGSVGVLPRYFMREMYNESRMIGQFETNRLTFREVIERFDITREYGRDG